MFFRSYHATRALRVFRQMSTSPAPNLSPESISIVKSTAPVIAEHGYSITRTMYKRMLSENSAVKEMFNPTHQVELPGETKARQPHTLACSVHAYAANIDNLGVLKDAVERIAQKHVSLHVLPEHYGVVKDNLFWAFGEVLGDAVTPEVAGAWSEAYDFLAWLLIERERTIREEKANAPGGWEGYRDFKVVEKKPESSEITSFILKPTDGQPLVNYEPGSYIAVRVTTPAGRTVRNYTLSSPPGRDSYRITVKATPPLIENAPKGAVSNHLHSSVNAGDVISLGVPCGDFMLDLSNPKPIVLISGGVGITPVVSMFEYLCENNTSNKVTMINCARNPSVEALHDEVLSFAKRNAKTDVHTIYDDADNSSPTTQSLMDKLESIVKDRDAHFYFCGPTAFMQKLHEGLRKDWKVPDDHIHFEFFGPMDNI